MLDLNRIAHTLADITDQSPVDWEAFDQVLSSLDNINYIDEKYGETILTEYLSAGRFYQRGKIMPTAIRHFLANGYDVLANNGRNGGLSLRGLCWTSYDRYILDAAKVLLDAGAPVNYRSNDDPIDAEPEGLLGDLGFKISGAWTADNDYALANIWETYYAIAKAYIEGKDYHTIRSYFDCIGLTLTAASAVNSGGGHPLQKKGHILQFSDSLVLWFGNTPLVVKKYIEFMVNPLYTDENSASLRDASSEFDPLLGAKLQRVRYIDSATCYLEFSNGYRLLFASHPDGNGDRNGASEIRPVGITKSIYDLKINEICRSGRIVYSDNVTKYGEEAVALFCDDGAYLLYTSLREYGTPRFILLKCSEDLLAEYDRRFPVPKPRSVFQYEPPDKHSVIKFDLGSEYLYFTATDYAGMDILLTELDFAPPDSFVFPIHAGKHMNFLPK